MAKKKPSLTVQPSQESSDKRLEVVCDSLLSKLEDLLGSDGDIADFLYQMKAIGVMLDCVKVLATVYEKVYDQKKREAGHELHVVFDDPEASEFAC